MSNTKIPELLDESNVRKDIVLWKQPVTTIIYFIRQVVYYLSHFSRRLRQRKVTLLAAAASFVLFLAANQINGPHHNFMLSAQKKLIWWSYWLGLGILSSIGLGSGLHTFILYLGPHIAAVTLAAYECKSVNFPEPPYPDQIICPLENNTLIGLSIFTIMAKVRKEALFWGAGTALGELPPYFMARGSRLSNMELEEAEDNEEVEELINLEHTTEHQTRMDKLKLYIKKLVENCGFFGILVFASIPNPLFDFAGVACGYFLVPFWTFFIATLIGKAVIKMHIQKLFVIFIFNKNQIERALNYISRIPLCGKQLEGPVKDYLAREKRKLYGENMALDGEQHILSWIFEKFVFLTMLYFLVNIVNSFAQSYHKRICKERRQQKIA